MRVLGPAIAGLLAGLSLADLPAEAGSRYGARIEQLPEGVGCYWYRGQLYCSRYCYWEIDGYRYCHPRVGNAISQAPPVLLYDFEPRRYDQIAAARLLSTTARRPRRRGPLPAAESQPIK